MPFEFFYSHGETERLAIGTVGGHSVESVGDHYDPRPDRNVLACQAIGVARAIEVFVVMSYDFLYGAAEPRSGCHELRASHNVRTHHHALFQSQPPVFSKKWSELFVDLPDVMQ